jgi:hypothetical protein
MSQQAELPANIPGETKRRPQAAFFSAFGPVALTGQVWYLTARLPDAESGRRSTPNTSDVDGIVEITGFAGLAQR